MNRLNISEYCVFPVLLAGLLLAPCLAQAASYTNSASGSWSATGSWVGGTVPPAGGAEDAVIAFEPSVADYSTNDLAGAFLLNQINVRSNLAVTLRSSGGSSLTLGGALPAVTNANNGVFTINSPVALATSVTMGGSGSIVVSGSITETAASSISKMGPGTLTLSATNTYTGGTVVNSGVLVLGNGCAIGGGSLTINGGTVSGNVTLANTNTVVLNGNCGLTGNLNTGSGSVVISQPLSITGNFNIPGLITGPGGLNTLDVTVVIPGTTSGVVLGAPVTLRTNQTFTVSVPVTSSVVVGGAMRDEGAGYGVTFGGSTYFDPQWTGQLCLTGSNTYSGATTVSTGVAVQIGNGGTTGSLNPASTIVLSSGGRVVFNRNNTILQGVDFGAITGAGEVVAKGGTLTLNSANTYTGATAVYGGTLKVAAIPNAGVISELGAYPTPGAGGLLFGGYVGNGGTFKYTGGTICTDRGFTLGRSTTLDISSSNTTLTMGTSSLGAAVLTVTGGVGSSLYLGSVDLTGNVTLSPTTASMTVGSISGAFALVKSGAGKLTLPGANTYTGGTTLSGGVLNISNDTALGVATGSLVFNGGTLQFAAGSSNVMVNAVRVVVLTPGTTSYIDTSLAGGVIAGPVSGSGTLVKIGAGMLTLSGNNTFTGNMTISGGNVIAGTVASIQSVVYNTSGSTNSVGLDLTGFTTLALGGLSGNINLATAITGYSGVSGVTLNSPDSASITYSGVISDGNGATTFTKIGDGTQTLVGTNTYTGATTINGGLLRITGSLHADSIVTVNAGAIGGTGTINGPVTLNGTGAIDLRDGATGTLTLGSALAITGPAGANALKFDLASNGAATDKLVVGGTLSLANPVSLCLNQLGSVNTRLAAGTYDLIISGQPLPAASMFTFSTTRLLGQTFALALDATSTKLQLTTTQAPAGPAAACWSGEADGNWSAAGNWNTSATSGVDTGSAPGYQGNVSFYTTTPAAANLNTVLDADFDINSLAFPGTATAPVTIGGTNTLTIEAYTFNGNASGSGITVNTPASGTVTHTINANLGIAASQTWTVNTNATLTVGGSVSDFSTGCGLNKAGSGKLNLNGATRVGSLFVGYSNGGAGILAVGSGGTVSVGYGPASNFYVGCSAGTGSFDASLASGFTVNLGNLYIGVSGPSNGGNGALLLGANNSMTVAGTFAVGSSVGGTGGPNYGTVTSPDSSMTTIYTPTFWIGKDTDNGTTAGTGTFVLGSGGTLAVAGISGGRTALAVGYSSGNYGYGSATKGTMDLSGGVASLRLSSLVVGLKSIYDTCAGILTLSTNPSNHLDISGSGSVVTIGSLLSGSSSSAYGTVTIGNLDATSAITSTDNSTAILVGYKGGTGTSAGTLTLQGGTLTITTTGSAIAGGGGTSKLNLSNVTLKPGSDSATWIQGLTTATLTNTVTVDTAGHAITVPQAFSGSGSLVKTGEGTLTLSGANTFTGSTIISTGTVAIAGSGSLASTNIIIRPDAVLDVAGKVTYAMPAGQTHVICLEGSVGRINAGALDIRNGRIAFSGAIPSKAGVYILASYTSLTGSAFASVTGLTPRYTIDYNYNNENKIALVVAPKGQVIRIK